MRTLLLAVVAIMASAGMALAVPDTGGLRVTDVTTSSFALVWMTNVPAAPAVEVYSDSSMTTRVDEELVITPMPDASPSVAEAARNKGIMKVRVAGALPSTRYYVRSVTADPVDPLSVGYSPLQMVQTQALAIPYVGAGDGSLNAFANDLVSFSVYLRPSESGEKAGEGDLLMLEIPGNSYPVTSFVGGGSVSSEAMLDLNNLFGGSGQSLFVQGGEKAVLRVYRGGGLATLLHYRRVPANSGLSVKQPVKGFFADINLDGKVDADDFDLFRALYGTAPDDAAYNPDYKFVQDPEGKVDIKDFASFAHEYGRAGVQ